MGEYRGKVSAALIVPREVLDELAVKSGDEVVFVRDGARFFITKRVSAAAWRNAPMLTEAELKLLMKLDEMRYNERTKEAVNKRLNDDERRILQRLLNRKYVSLFKKGEEGEGVYSISGEVYSRFMFGRRGQDAASIIADVMAGNAAGQQGQEHTGGRGQEQYMHALETNGYLVLDNRDDATKMSIALEDSIKAGRVIGTRAFNKRYYVAMKSFIERYASKLLKQIEKRGVTAPELAVSMGINVDAVRTILYILAEQGEVSELKKDVFRAA